MLFLDLDHVKTLNDRYGHAGGDAVLRELADVARAALRGVDTLGRWGGGEFVALLPEAGAEEALAAAERMRAAVVAHAFRAGGGAHLTCALGLARYPQHGEERDRLVELADRAMYAALGLETGTAGSREEVALAGTVEALVEARDQYTQAVATLTLRLALALGLDATEAHMVGVAGSARACSRGAPRTCSSMRCWSAATPLGLLKPRGKQRTDSTHVLAAVRALNRLECVGETLRQALNMLALVAPGWLRAQAAEVQVCALRRRFERPRPPRAPAARETRRQRSVHDLQLTAHDGPAWRVGQVPAVATLRRVWAEYFTPPTSVGALRLRDPQEMLPAALTIHSPYDPDARDSTQRSTTWTGYKVHVTENVRRGPAAPDHTGGDHAGHDAGCGRDRLHPSRLGPP